MGSKYDPELGVIAIGATCLVAAAAGCLGLFLVAAVAGLAVSHVGATKLKEDTADRYAGAEQALDDEWAGMSETDRRGELGKSVKNRLRQLCADRLKDERNAQTMSRVAGLAVFADPLMGAAGVAAATVAHTAGKKQRKQREAGELNRRQKCAQRAHRKETDLVPAEAIVL